LIPLTHELREQSRHITIETAGTLYLPVACDLMSISPKLANSTPALETAGRWRHRHDQARRAPGVIERLTADFSYQVKFVIDRRDDCEDVEQYLAAAPGIRRERVLLMPQGVDAEALDQRRRWLEPYCREAGLGFCPRRQIEWFGPVRGT
jgi:7-carboxy-7-deazaguanine synthase